MDAKSQAKYEARAKIVKAMAHPARLLVLDELSKNGERCVCELTEMVGVDMSTVSRYLALLKNAGIIEDRQQGSMVYYRLQMSCVLKFFDCIESVTACNAEHQRRLLT